MKKLPYLLIFIVCFFIWNTFKKDQASESELKSTVILKVNTTELTLNNAAITFRSPKKGKFVDMVFLRLLLPDLSEYGTKVFKGKVDEKSTLEISFSAIQKNMTQKKWESEKFEYILKKISGVDGEKNNGFTVYESLNTRYYFPDTYKDKVFFACYKGSQMMLNCSRSVALNDDIYYTYKFNEIHIDAWSVIDDGVFSYLNASVPTYSENHQDAHAKPSSQCKKTLYIQQQASTRNGREENIMRATIMITA